MIDPEKLLKAAPTATLSEARRWLEYAATDLIHARHLLECEAEGICETCGAAHVALGYQDEPATFAQ